MKIKKTKLYCFADETGQDTKGKFFLVSIILSGREQLDNLRSTVLKIEKINKGKTKWTRTDNLKKREFIKEILQLKLLKDCLYYSVYHNSTAYIPLTALAISKAVIVKTKKVKNYKVNIIIDGLNPSEKDQIRKEFKGLNIKYDKIKVNLKDEQDVLLRLADALAGFIRDYLEDRKYLAGLLNKERFRNTFKEI